MAKVKTPKKPKFLKLGPYIKPLKMPCLHRNLYFSTAGQFLNCMDCKRRWLSCQTEAATPDYTYFDQNLSPFETRHAPGEPPRPASQAK